MSSKSARSDESSSDSKSGSDTSYNCNLKDLCLKEDGPKVLCPEINLIYNVMDYNAYWSADKSSKSNGCGNKSVPKWAKRLQVQL